jgi:hypothetical protein
MSGGKNAAVKERHRMTPQERDLLNNLIGRLRQSPPQQCDAEAQSLINDLVREKPDTPYILAQTVLIQDYALHQAQARIADLEQQLKAPTKQESGGFLGAIFGSGKPPQVQSPQPQYQPGYAQPAAGPWGPAPAQMGAPQMFAQGGQPSFLRSAATTAAGIAGGALLFEGIESLMGGHGGFGGGYGGAGFMGQPGITETVVNNYYGDDAPGGHDTQPADFSQAGFDNSGSNDGGFTDASFDDNGDFGGDFGGDSSI